MPNRRRVSAADTAPNLSISTEKVCFVIAKVREFDAKDVLTDEDDASNPSDDRMVEVLEDHDDDPVLRELSAFIGAMSEDEKVDLVALTWLGRGDGGLETGRICARKRPARTASAPPPTCSHAAPVRSLGRGALAVRPLVRGRTRMSVENRS
ncbi:MAG TPA: DUF3775 domain-containing protein [Xanthobacteraceae bacterium]|nr:DUF3775 domain-containing protein [Xanthobacteraceae bacterium]